MQLRWCTSWSSNQYIELYGVHEMCCLFVRLLEERKEDGRDLVWECSAHIHLHDPTDRSRQRSGNAITRMNGTRKKAHKQQIFCSVAALNISKTINKSVIAISNVVWKKGKHFHLILSNFFAGLSQFDKERVERERFFLWHLLYYTISNQLLESKTCERLSFTRIECPSISLQFTTFYCKKCRCPKLITHILFPLENTLSERCSHCITFDWNHIYSPVHILW